MNVGIKGQKRWQSAINGEYRSDPLGQAAETKKICPFQKSEKIMKTLSSYP
jgi:hypothetical protein